VLRSKRHGWVPKLFSLRLQDLLEGTLHHTARASLVPMTLLFLRARKSAAVMVAADAEPILWYWHRHRHPKLKTPQGSKMFSTDACCTCRWMFFLGFESSKLRSSDGAGEGYLSVVRFHLLPLHTCCEVRLGTRCGRDFGLGLRQQVEQGGADEEPPRLIPCQAGLRE
jgi:hypothetical protein